MAQFEKLWGDMTGLAEVACQFVVVPRLRGQQLKEQAQLDVWLRDGSAGLRRFALRRGRSGFAYEGDGLRHRRAYFPLNPSFLARAKSSLALAFSPFFSKATPRFQYASPSFGLSPMASVRSAMALSHSLFSASIRPRAMRASARLFLVAASSGLIWTACW